MSFLAARDALPVTQRVLRGANIGRCVQIIGQNGRVVCANIPATKEKASKTSANVHINMVLGTKYVRRQSCKSASGLK
jgi:hypothetical protein